MTDYSAASDRSQVISENIYELVATREGARFTIFRQLTAGLVLALIICVLNYITPAHTTLAEHIYGSTMLIILMVPLWLWRMGIDPNPPFIVLIGLFYFYTYGFGVFLLKEFSGNLYQQAVSPQWIDAGLRLSIVGMACMLAGYYLWPLTPFNAMIPRFHLKWTDARAVKFVGLILVTGGLAFSILSIPVLPKSLAQIQVYAADTFTFGICFLMGLWSLGRLKARAAFLLFGVLIPLRLGEGLITGLAGNSIVIIFTLILMYAAMTHRIPWVIIVIGTAALFIFRPLETPYRNAAWSPQGELHNASDVQKAQYMYGLIYRTIMGNEFTADELIQITGARLSMFPMLGDVMSQTPSVVPYWGGETYYPLLFKLIPRIVWPDKPEEITGLTFGHRYGFSSPENIDTSIDLPQLIEQYANFGLLGVVIGMFIIGMIYRLLLSMFVHPEMGLGALVAAVFVVSSLFDLGSTTSIVFGGIPWTLLYVFLVDRFVLLLHFELSGVDQRIPVTVAQ